MDRVTLSSRLSKSTSCQRSQEFADAKSRAGVEQYWRPLPDSQFAGQQLNFDNFQNIKGALWFRALANEVD